MLVLRPETEISIDDPREPELYFTAFDVAIKHESRDPADWVGLPEPLDANKESGVAQAHVGDVFCTRLHIWNATNVGVDLFEICDSVDQHWHELYSAFLRSDDNEFGFYRNLPELRDCCTGDLLLIDDIELAQSIVDNRHEMKAPSVVEARINGVFTRCEPNQIAEIKELGEGKVIVRCHCRTEKGGR